LALAEKSIEFESILLDLTQGQQYEPDYLKLNPNGVVPTLRHGDEVIIESNVINEYIDDAFDGPALRPATAAGRARMRLWTKRLDEQVHPRTITLSFAIAFRQRFLSQSEEEREGFLRKSPSDTRRALMRDLIDNGVKSTAFPTAVHTFDKMLGDLDNALANTAWLAGDEFSLADIGYTPYLTRLEHLTLDRLWRDKPRVADWYGRIRSRPSYQQAIDAWLPAPLIAGLNRAGEKAWPTVQAILND
jgi:glutathione S-transferase